MSIMTLDQWFAGPKQIIPFSKLAARTTVGNRWFSTHDLAGNPGASALAVGNTAAGVVPIDATNGFPPIAFTSGAGLLNSVGFGCTVACRLMVYDRVFHAGAYNFNDAISLAAQPSYSTRMPGGKYEGTELWYEQVTLGVGTQSVAVTYMNALGVTGHTTGTVVVGVTPIVGSLFQLPLAAGDNGLQKVESVTGTIATGGTFNIVVARPLWQGRVWIANGGDLHGPDRTGAPQIFTDSALAVMLNADSTSSGLPDLDFVIVSG